MASESTKMAVAGNVHMDLFYKGRTNFNLEANVAI